MATPCHMTMVIQTYTLGNQNDGKRKNDKNNIMRSFSKGNVSKLT
jgi:hypothetical protein